MDGYERIDAEMGTIQPQQQPAPMVFPVKPRGFVMGIENDSGITDEFDNELGSFTKIVSTGKPCAFCGMTAIE